MINIKKQGFTLVELIVVITILAILGSIAFISLQGYSSDARNSKRTSDLSSIQSSLTVKQTSGTDLTAFVLSDTNGNEVANVSIGGQTNPTGYAAGPVNYSALGMKSTDFQDPQSNKSYIVGITTLAGGAYQVASTMEQSGGSKTARVVGNWNPRTAAPVVTTATGTTVVLNTATDVNKFKLADVVDLGTNTGVVNRISADGMTITFSTGSDTTSIQLAASESPALINAGTDTTTTGNVTDNGTALPY